MKTHNKNAATFVRRGMLSAVLVVALAAQIPGAVSALDVLTPPTDLGGETSSDIDHSARSLYSGPAPRPGPALLYAPAPRAPQLENTGIWRARPILISGASAYRKGEFLYQDFVYDDHGANSGARDPNDPRLRGSTFSGPNGTYTYPTNPVYANNAADFVELRVKQQSKETAFRVTLNSLIDPSRVAFTIALGDSPVAREFPFGANVRAPAKLFVTVHGSSAVITDAATGQTLAPAPTVTVDLERRQFEVRVARVVWDPVGIERIAAGVGLWDSANNRYLLPAAVSNATAPGGAGALLRPAAFFNVAFRYDEPMPNPADLNNTSDPAWWRDRAQGAALRAGDISRFHALVDFTKLNAGGNDDMPGQFGGVPQYGPMNRIYASRFETQQGVDFASACGNATSCKGALRGQLQPYAIYIPSKPRPAEGYGFTLLLHSLGANYNQYLSTRNQSQLGERGRGHLVATPAGRGPDGWYVDHAEADAFEMWADIARHYPLDAEMTNISGYSMGGYGTFKLTTRYPDLFARAHTVVGPPALGIWAPPAAPTGGEGTNTYYLLEGVRNIPFLMWVQAADELVPYTGTNMQARRFDELGYRYRFDTFTTGEHLTLARHDQYQPSAEFLADAEVDRDPHHVSYVVNPAMDFSDIGLVGDHAYWLSGLTVRDRSAAVPRGSIDVRSWGFGVGDPTPQPTQTGAGTLTGGNLVAQAYVSQYKTWSDAPARPVLNQLDIRARNMATVTIHPRRARVGCDASLNVDTDGPLLVILDGCNRQVQFQ